MQEGAGSAWRWYNVAEHIAKKKVQVKDLKAKDAGRVKGGAAYLKIGDITSESHDKDHKDWVDIKP